MNEAERIIAILVDRLGGDVEISVAELEHTDLDLTGGKYPGALSYILRTHHRADVDEELVSRPELDRIAYAGLHGTARRQLAPFDALKVV